MTNDADDLFDDEVKSESSGGSDGGSSGVSRRKFLKGTGGAAAAGAIIGVAGTVGVSLLIGDDDAPSADAVATTPSTGTTATGTVPAGAGMGVPDDAAVSDAVVTLNVNGRGYRVSVNANDSLAEVLRRKLNLTGTNIGCDRSECSACTVQIDGVATNACSVLAIRQGGTEITTIEGLEQDGVLSPVQEAFLTEMGLQCGFCTPGQIMQATALLQANPNPSVSDVRRGMSGNLCKCSAYTNILEAVLTASKDLA